MGIPSCQLQYLHTAQPSDLEQNKSQPRRADEEGGGGHVIQKDFLKEKKKTQTFMFPIYNHHPPPLLPQFYCRFHILFCFQVTFQEKVIIGISQFLKIAQHLNHKPLPTRSQFSSYWLWFIDERNSQLCCWGLNRSNLVPGTKIKSQEHPRVYHFLPG